MIHFKRTWFLRNTIYYSRQLCSANTIAKFSTLGSSLLQESQKNSFGAFTPTDAPPTTPNERAQQFRDMVQEQEQKQREQRQQRRTQRAKTTKTLLFLSSIIALMSTLTFSAYIYFDDLKNGPLNSRLDNLKRLLHGGSYRDYILLDDPRRVILGEGMYHYKDDRQSVEEFTEKQAKEEAPVNPQSADFTVQKNFEFKLRLPKDKFLSPGVVVQDQLDAVGSAGSFSMTDDFGSIFATSLVFDFVY